MTELRLADMRTCTTITTCTMYVTFVTVPKVINKMLSKPFVAARDDLPAEEMQTTEFYS